MTETRTPPAPTTPGSPKPGCAIDLRQMLTMTDDTGIFQHARIALPDPNHGYCVDDNARALIAACRLRPAEHPEGQPGTEALVNRYLTFTAYAVDPQTHRVRNFMDYNRRWLEDVGSNDSQARALWGLAVAAGEAPLAHQRQRAAMAFAEALQGTAGLDSLRTWAFLIIALDRWVDTESGKTDEKAQKRLEIHAEQLAAGYRNNATKAWPWWEPVMSYDNARLPLAMLIAGRRLDQPDYTTIGLASLRWLIESQTHADAGHLSIIGNDGWYARPQPGQCSMPAAYDQQPLEAAALIDACAAALAATGDAVWCQEAERCFAWYHGQNDLGAPLIHAETGGCQDGLTPHGVNLNQGAESVLSYVMSCQAMRTLRG